MAKDFVIHTPEEIIRIKEAARRAAIARDKIAEYVRPGMTTKVEYVDHLFHFQEF